MALYTGRTQGGILVDTSGNVLLGQATMANSIPVAIASNQTALPVPSGGLTDRSGTITAGGTAQQVAASNTSRKYLLVQNNSTSDLWVSLVGSAVQSQPSIRLVSLAVFTMEAGFIGTGAVSIIGATTGQAFTAWEG